jgi:hypothetical protein
MKQKEHLQAIPPEVITQIQQKLDDINTLLSPYSISLTPVKRRDMYVMGDKSAVFVEKAFDLARQNPPLVPSYMDMDEFLVDKSDAMGLRTVLNTAQQVVQGISDTSLAAGSEAMEFALIFYNAVKIAALHDVQGAKAVYEELRKRFPGNKRRPSGSEPETGNGTV